MMLYVTLPPPGVEADVSLPAVSPHDGTGVEAEVSHAGFGLDAEVLVGRLGARAPDRRSEKRCRRWQMLGPPVARTDRR